MLQQAHGVVTCLTEWMASCKGPEKSVEHAGFHKMDSIATAQSVMPVHPDWLPCISGCKVLPALTRQHAQKGMLQQ